MAPRKTERLLNLTIALLSSRRYLPRERIRDMVEGYAGLSDAAFERAFERDKDELRKMGIPVETGSNDALFDDELGYRIVRADFELPPVSFTPDEVAALGSAAQVWQHASSAERTAHALARLRAVGIEPDSSRLAALAPRVSAPEPAFEPLWQATLSRTSVGFRYRGGTEDRVVEPWRLTWRRGAWYLLGFDRGRDAPRMFKLSRMSTLPEAIGAAGDYTVPTGVDLAELSRSLEPSGPDSAATVAIRSGRAPGLRRRGQLVDPQPRPLLEGYQAWCVDYATGGDFVAEVASAGPDVLVLAPESLRAHVQAQLAAVVARHGKQG